MLTIFGACVVTFMMVMYALERRDRRFVLAFALGCALSSSYGFLAGTWPFGVVEAIWAVVALKRYLDHGPGGEGRLPVSAARMASSAAARAGSSTTTESRRRAGS